MTACQQEEYEVLTEESENGFTSDSEFFSLVSRAAKKDGSADDELDESPCFSLKFPFVIELSGVEVKVTSSSELEKLVAQLEDANDDDFSLQFPVTLILSNYESVTVSGNQEFEELQENCEEQMENDSGPITCAKIVFPIKVFAYNMNTQQTTSFNIANNQQLYTFLENTDSREVLSFDYPITVAFSNSNRLIVNNGKEFSDVLKTCLE